MSEHSYTLHNDFKLTVVCRGVQRTKRNKQDAGGTLDTMLSVNVEQRPQLPSSECTTLVLNLAGRLSGNLVLSKPRYVRSHSVARRTWFSRPHANRFRVRCNMASATVARTPSSHTGLPFTSDRRLVARTGGQLPRARTGEERLDLLPATLNVVCVSFPSKFM